MEILCQRIELLLLLLSKYYIICLTQQSTQALDLRGKNTAQSSTYMFGGVSYSSDLAVDHNYATQLNFCSRTDSEVNPWWYVDLGAQYIVTQVILYAGQGAAFVLEGTEVRVGNVAVEPFTGNGQCGSTITSGNLDQNTNQYSVTCSSSVVGRYVTLYRSDSSVATLVVCEVTIYGELAVNCPEDITVGVSSGQTRAIANWNSPTITVGLTATCTPPSGSSFGVGNNIVTCSATDSNSNTGSCTFLVIVPDNENPSISCPANRVGYTHTSEAAVTWDDPTVSDNVDTGVSTVCTPPSGSSFNIGPSTVTCSATDAAGNTDSCTFSVYVNQDTESPIVTCPGDITRSTTSGYATVTWNGPTVTDNVDSHLTSTCNARSGLSWPVGMYFVTCSATDSANNYGSCQFKVVIVLVPDIPSVTCPDDIPVDTLQGQSTATVTWSEPTVSHNMDTDLTANCTPSSGSSFSVGTNTITCTSTDSAGNVGDCTFTVTVFDIESPSVTCPDDNSISTASSQATVTWNDPTVNDNVDTDLPVTCTPLSGSSFNVGSNNVTCSATDSSSNTGSCMFRVNVVEDKINPSVTCPANIAVSAGSKVTWDDPTVADNVDNGLSATCTPPSGSSFDVGKNNVTCSATDNADNKGSCMFVVKVTEDDSSSNTVVIAVVISLIVVLLLIVALILICRKQVKKKVKKSPDAITFSANKGISGNGLEQQIHEPLTPEITRTQDNDTEIYINQDIRKPAISIQDLPEYVRMKKASGELDEEWELLPEGVESSQRASVAFDSQNATKNRYRNVVPYDEHRVVLEKIPDDPYSDYINACFIKGFTIEKGYIAAQGPNKTTIVDFWRMIWQENVFSIVMVTNLVEDGKNKCAKYWPDDAKKYGDILISTVEFVSTTSFDTRKLRLMKGKDVKFVKQYHFLVWPDKNIPRASSPVISMLKVIRKEEPQNAGPLLVHCSAGAGRTGAIIAIDAMMDMAQQTQEVNVFEFVKDMRTRRPNMVQTPLQYKFVYDTILEFVTFGETSVPVSDFKEHYKKLQHVNPKSKKTYLSEEFEALQSVSSTLEAGSTKGGLRPENRDKNRYPEILPFDRNRPFIMTPGENGPSDYINASFFDSFDKKDMFLGTQAPMRNTVEDFWRMIVDYNSKAIVTLNDYYNRDKTVAQFWPENGSTYTFKHLTVTMLKIENLSKQVIVHTVNILKTDENSESLNVKIFEYLGWPAEKYIPTSSTEFLQLVTVVNKRQSEIGDAPIVVMCMDGVGRTGVFCATLSILRKVNEEQTVDIVQGVKLLRNNRPGMVETLSQYEFIYKTVLEHLLAFEVYDNVPQETGEEAVYANV